MDVAVMQLPQYPLVATPDTVATMPCTPKVTEWDGADYLSDSSDAEGSWGMCCCAAQEGLLLLEDELGSPGQQARCGAAAGGPSLLEDLQARGSIFQYCIQQGR
jgi:hypothetical protein